IRAKLEELLGKPIAQSRALLIPTELWGEPACSPQTMYNSIAGRSDGSVGLSGLGWQSVGVLELTALPTIAKERWMPWVHDAGVLRVDGGEAVYLAHWM